MDLKALNAAFREALPKGWRGRVIKYAGGIKGYVQRAPVDLLAQMKANGLPLGHAMHFEAQSNYAFGNFMKPRNAFYMGRLWMVLVEAVNDQSVPVYIGIGDVNDPFLHVVRPPKELHPKVQAYADHAKGTFPGVLKVHDDLKAKRLFPHGKPKHAHHTWA
jgi:hypothetical protein